MAFVIDGIARGGRHRVCLAAIFSAGGSEIGGIVELGADRIVICRGDRNGIFVNDDDSHAVLLGEAFQCQFVLFIDHTHSL